MRRADGKRLVLGCVLAGLLAAQSAAVGVPRKSEARFVVPETAAVEIRCSRHTQAETEYGEIANRLGTENYQKILENSRVELWVRPDTASVRVVDRTSGYIWGSLPGDTADDMNEAWVDMANSLVTIEYYNTQNAVIRLSCSDPSVSVDYAWDAQTLYCKMNAGNAGIALTVGITLTEDGVEFELQPDSIEETGENLLKSVYFAPFFGCTRGEEIPGYMFVPDGSGALIRYAPGSRYISGFEKKVYGDDIGIDNQNSGSDLMSKRTNDYMVEMARLSVPVFGVVHGAKQHAFLARIEGGEEFAVITASPAGVITDLNWVTARFDYRQLYVQPVGNGNEGIPRVQAERNEMTPRLRFFLLEGDEADYNGMALKYRSLLEQEGLLKDERVDGDIPMRLSLVGADVKEGFFSNSLTTFTTVQDALRIAEELEQMGISNLTMLFQGWQKGGLNGASYATARFQKSVGSQSAFEGLRDAVQTRGGRFYLGVSALTANEDQINTSYAAATTLSRQLAKYTRDNQTILYPDTYVIRPQRAYGSLLELFSKLKGFRLHPERLGELTYADYSRDSAVSRTTQMKMTKKIAEQADEHGAALSRPNSYVWAQTAEYFDIPLVNSQYIYETDSVPFLQMVLKGHIDYYASYCNQGSFEQNDVLKLIEYGAYPSFLAIATDNIQLKGTPLEDYFSLNFEDWKTTMGDVYARVNAVLKEVEGAHILQHTVLQPGIVRVRYDNGTAIYVNYTEKEAACGSVSVPAKGCHVEKEAGA